MKQETLEEAATNYTIDFATMSAFKLGAKWQEQNSDKRYSEEEVFDLMNEYADDVMGGCNFRAKKWFEHFKNK